MTGKNIAWTSQQIKILELLPEAKGPAEISKQQGVLYYGNCQSAERQSCLYYPADKPPPKPTQPPGGSGNAPPSGVTKASSPADANKVVSQYTEQAQAEAEAETEAEEEETCIPGVEGDGGTEYPHYPHYTHYPQHHLPPGYATVMKMV